MKRAHAGVEQLNLAEAGHAVQISLRWVGLGCARRRASDGVGTSRGGGCCTRRRPRVAPIGDGDRTSVVTLRSLCVRIRGAHRVGTGVRRLRDRRVPFEGRLRVQRARRGVVRVTCGGWWLGRSAHGGMVAWCELIV